MRPVPEAGGARVAMTLGGVEELALHYPHPLRWPERLDGEDGPDARFVSRAAEIGLRDGGAADGRAAAEAVFAAGGLPALNAVAMAAVAEAWRIDPEDVPESEDPPEKKARRRRSRSGPGS